MKCDGSLHVFVSGILLWQPCGIGEKPIPKSPQFRFKSVFHLYCDGMSRSALPVLNVPGSQNSTAPLTRRVNGSQLLSSNLPSVPQQTFPNDQGLPFRLWAAIEPIHWYGLSAPSPPSIRGRYTSPASLMDCQSMTRWIINKRCLQLV